MRGKCIHQGAAGIIILCVILALCVGCNGDSDNGPENKPPEPVKYSIDTSGTFSNGTISVKNNIKEAAEGDTITLIAEPAKNFYLVLLIVKGTESNTNVSLSGSGNERTFTMPSEPVSVTGAAFMPSVQEYGISIGSQYVYGAVTTEDGHPYLGRAQEGQTVTLIIIPEPGYYLSSLTVEGKTSGDIIKVTIGEGTATFIMPGEDVNIPGGGNADINKDGAIFLPIVP